MSSQKTWEFSFVPLGAADNKIDLLWQNSLSLPPYFYGALEITDDNNDKE
ncbi:MAG: hypothetical protein ACI8RD_001954 [Bacillariaceae sp.]|jgi:hypothetical protein